MSIGRVPRPRSKHLVTDRQEDVPLGASASLSPCSRPGMCVLWEQRALSLDFWALWTQPAFVPDCEAGGLCLPGSPLLAPRVGVSLSLEEGRALSQGWHEGPAPHSLPRSAPSLPVCPASFSCVLASSPPLSPQPLSDLLGPGLTWGCHSQGHPCSPGAGDQCPLPSHSTTRSLPGTPGPPACCPFPRLRPSPPISAISSLSPASPFLPSHAGSCLAECEHLPALFSTSHLMVLSPAAPPQHPQT